MMVVGMAQCMLKAEGLLGWLWGEVVVVVVYIHNQVRAKQWKEARQRLRYGMVESMLFII
jgi:hypothetical protein